MANSQSWIRPPRWSLSHSLHLLAEKRSRDLAFLYTWKKRSVAFSNTLLLRSLQMDQQTIVGTICQICFPWGFNAKVHQLDKTEGNSKDITQVRPKSHIIAFNTSTTKGEWSRLWDIDSPSPLHNKQMFGRYILLRFRLSMIEILPREMVRRKI